MSAEYAAGAEMGSWRDVGSGGSGSVSGPEPTPGSALLAEAERLPFAGWRSFLSIWSPPDPTLHRGAAGLTSLGVNGVERQTGVEMPRISARKCLPAPDRDIDKMRIDFQPSSASADPLRRKDRRAGAAKGIEYDLIPPRAVL